METGKGEGGRQGVFFPCGGGGSRECGGGSSAVGLLFVRAASVGNEAGKKTGGGLRGRKEQTCRRGKKSYGHAPAKKRLSFARFPARRNSTNEKIYWLLGQNF